MTDQIIETKNPLTIVSEVFALLMQTIGRLFSSIFQSRFRSSETALAVVRYNFTAVEYVNTLRHFVGAKDVVCAIVKGGIYGAVIPIISCTYGFRCEGGAEGVGTATTDSVVTSTIAIILLDFILTYLFTLIL